MQHYCEFEEKVKGLASEFEDWKHVLPVVKITCRERYLTALAAGLDMPGAFDAVLLCNGAPEDVFRKIIGKLKKGKVN